MSSSENLLKAAFNRITLRLEKGLANTANELSNKAKNIPEQIKLELEILKEEIIQEANRLENKSTESKNESNKPNIYTERINKIRSKVKVISEKLEGIN
tara:strand:+ start:455 stop:751 length:297 start_codon:yes stop_codon:yes gene_type:complete